MKSTVIRQAVEPFERISKLVPRLQMNVDKVIKNKKHSKSTSDKKETNYDMNTVIPKSTIIDNTTPVGLLVSFNNSNNLLIATTEADTQLAKFGN